MGVQLDINPLRVGLPRERSVDPSIFVIFGGTGDLAGRKLLPAIYQLYLGGLLPRAFAVVAYASDDWTTEQFREFVRNSVAGASRSGISDETWAGFAGLLHYSRRTDDMIRSLNELKTCLDEVDSSMGIGGNYLFYMSVPPFVVPDTMRGMGEVGLAGGEGWRRIVVEKPFGQDLDSARNLNRVIQSVWHENQVYRIDHYLGKETVQNITVFRFANECITPLLNSRYVDHIQITVAERIGIEGRGGYYESTGALRDMVQNHLLQVMSLVCMEPPASLDAEAVRDEKVRLFRAVRRIEPGDVAAVSTRGQYGSGRLLGEQVAGYREEKGVAPDSTTETFVALKLHIDNPRWEGAPVYLRTGKRLAKRASEIAIRLKNVPAPLFGEGDGIHPNVISINIQPDEGVALLFEAKTPGLDYRIQPVRMEFKYGTGFGASVPEAYERLILDALSGDQSLYTRADGLDATWEICDPLLRAWQSGEPPLFTYRPGIWGPREADDLILRDGRKWRML